MSSFSGILPTAEANVREQFTEDATSYFRRRILSNRRWLWPRRYVMALMIFVLLLIEVSRHWNVAFTLVYIIMSDEYKGDYPSIGNWTVSELENLGTIMQVGDIFANFLGALLIYQYSSHRFLLISVAVSSLLHILTPAALNHHSVIFLLFVMIGQEIISVPVFTAALSTWKDWAPPAERTRLVTISLCGIVLEATFAIFFLIVFPHIFQSSSYYVGIAGLVWALFWYNTTSDIPQDDPLISEKEFLYIESTIPSNIQEKIKLKDVPWKSIIMSKQVMILCSIYFKIACSVETIQIAGVFFIFHLPDTYDPLLFFIPFMAAVIIILIGSSFLMDFLIQRYRNKSLTIRKMFLCTGFGLQSVFMLGAIISSEEHIKAISYILTYSIVTLSIPGALTYPLDLSPRYVSILAGIGFAFFSLGTLCFQYFVEHAFEWMKVNTVSWLFIFDAIISLCIAIIFGVWGDVEEQSWSLITSSHRRSNDYKSYPQPDDEDDINLVPENL